MVCAMKNLLSIYHYGVDTFIPGGQTERGNANRQWGGCPIPFSIREVKAKGKKAVLDITHCDKANLLTDIIANVIR